MTKRRRFSGELKAKVALEALRGSQRPWKVTRSSVSAIMATQYVA